MGDKTLKFTVPSLDVERRKAQKKTINEILRLLVGDGRNREDINQILGGVQYALDTEVVVSLPAQGSKPKS